MKITKDYALAAAKAFEEIPIKDGRPFNFVYVSGSGATFKPGRLTPIFGRVKGETELALAEMRKANANFRANTVRPGGIDREHHDAIKRYLPESGAIQRTASNVLFTVLRSTYKDSLSPTKPLGQFLVQMAMGERNDLEGPGVEKIGDFTVVENSAIRRYMSW